MLLICSYFLQISFTSTNSKHPILNLLAENSSVCCFTQYLFLQPCVSIRSVIYTFPSLPLLSYQVLHIFILNHLSHSIQNFHILSQGLPESFFADIPTDSRHSLSFLHHPNCIFYIRFIFIKTH